MSVPVLEADRISVARGGRQILSDISLTVGQNARALVQGPSGSGKTTLFNVFGLLDRPTDGSLSIGGSLTNSLSSRERARLRRETIGFVFQDFQLVPDLTAWENAALPQDHGGERDESWLRTLFTRLDIEDLRTQYPATLSGGEKQRVAIARALANRPQLVLADEPTGQLDPETTEQVLEFLLQLQAETETALVAISHDRRLDAYFSETYILEDAQLVPKHLTNVS